MSDGSGRPPKQIILGLTIGQWPMVVFADDASGRAHALGWIAKDPDRRCLWACGVLNARELQYLPPGEARLVNKE